MAAVQDGEASRDKEATVVARPWSVADLGFEPRVCLGKTSRYNMVQFNMQFGNITTKFSK